MSFLTSTLKKLGLKSSTVRTAMRGDADSVKSMFSTFLVDNEEIEDCAYLGVRGLWGLGHHCWACVTDRRAASILIGPLRGVSFKDIHGDRIDHAEFHQPSSWTAFPAVLIMSISWLLVSSLFCQPVLDVIDDYLSLDEKMEYLVEAFLIAFPLPFVWYFALAFSRRIIKRGILLRGRNSTLNVFCDRAMANDGCRIMRQTAALRERRMKFVAIS